MTSFKTKAVTKNSRYSSKNIKNVSTLPLQYNDLKIYVCVNVFKLKIGSGLTFGIKKI